MKLTLKARKALPSSDFVFPKTRAYPIEDRDHAEAAERLVGREHSASMKAKVDAAVHERYPQLGKKKKKSKKAAQRQAGSMSLASML